MKKIIKQLVESFGPVGFEDEVRALISAEIEPFVDSLTVDNMGNLIAHKKGDGSGLKVMIAGHMDEIGFMVSHITKEGFIRFASLGGVFPGHLPGTRVRFADGTIGVIYRERGTDRTKMVGIDKHYIDVGATSADDCPVSIGDVGIFWQPYTTQGDRIIAKSVDDRIACAIMIASLQSIEPSPHELYYVFTVQEEVGVRGATVAANRLAPDVGIAIDVTGTGDTPDGIKMAVKMGHGPAIKIKDSGFVAHRGLVQVMKDRADSAEIPYQPEVLPAGSTDARAMQISGAGVAAGCISIPCRYIHSTSETVSYSDVQNSLKLLNAILEQPIPL